MTPEASRYWELDSCTPRALSEKDSPSTKLLPWLPASSSWSKKMPSIPTNSPYSVTPMARYHTGSTFSTVEGAMPRNSRPPCST